MFTIEFNDLQRILKAFGHDDFTCSVVADYLDELDYDLNLSQYLWNTLLFNVHVFETKKEALEYIEEEGIEYDDYTLFECYNDNGIYLEVY